MHCISTKIYETLIYTSNELCVRSMWEKLGNLMKEMKEIKDLNIWVSSPEMLWIEISRSQFFPTWSIDLRQYQ